MTGGKLPAILLTELSKNHFELAPGRNWLLRDRIEFVDKNKEEFEWNLLKRGQKLPMIKFRL